MAVAPPAVLHRPAGESSVLRLLVQLLVRCVTDAGKNDKKNIKTIKTKTTIINHVITLLNIINSCFPAAAVCHIKQPSNSIDQTVLLQAATRGQSSYVHFPFNTLFPSTLSDTQRHSYV